MPRRPPPPDPNLEALLDRTDAAFASGEPERALSFADEALLIRPKSVDAWQYRAEALAALGRFDDARQAYATALKLAPDDLDVLRGAVDLRVIDLADDHEALEEGLALARRAISIARKKGDRESLVELLVLAAVGLGHASAPKRALALLDEAADLAPEDAGVALERGIALFQLLRLDEAESEIGRALRLDRREARAHHYLALIAERQGNASAAQRHFREARRLSPEDFPQWVEVSAEAFDTAVEDALDRLPARVCRYLSNVTISVEELPAAEDLTECDPPLSPEIVGLFAGTALTERSTADPWTHFPSAITLYQRNLQRTCRTREELIEQIGITLIHEVGHFLGLTEEELYDRGLD